MKVVHQLISYFHERGQFTDSQLEEFAKKGFWGLYKSSDLRSLEKRIGETFLFQATGEMNGPLWGTDVYTSDSSLGLACVHAGVLKIGETGMVRVTMVTPLAVFQGSTQNGVNSSTWTTGWSGAYTVAVFKPVSPSAGDGKQPSASQNEEQDDVIFE